MKARLEKLLWKIAAVLVIVGVIGTVFLSRSDNTTQKAAQKAVEETRQTLRQQGFKTDLADFDFSTSAELQARAAILENAIAYRNPNPFVDYPNLMEVVGSNSAIVVWRQDSLKRQYSSRPGDNDELSWEEFREAINEHQPELDSACAAVLSGPIRFNLNASGGNAIPLPHLSMLKNLTQKFDSRAMFNLHDGNKDAAWTNLLASTRLITAWEPEPAEISHLVRFGNMNLVFNATWQALQMNGWSDNQLARLQLEWESVDFFKHLPETAAFKRASDVAMCRQERQQEYSNPRPTFSEFFKEALRFPPDVWIELNERWNQVNYQKYGRYEDEKALLLFYRDRELELRNAVQAPTWSAMRQLPGIIKEVLFQSKYHSRMQAMLNLKRIGIGFQREGSSLLGRAAKTEAQRRLIITALALERYHGKHGSYPKTLVDLVPEFLKTAPIDFMDGQSLRYRLTDDGHFILYSIGLDCVDDGGKMPSHEWETRFPGGATRFAAPPQADIVWPLPASMADVSALRQKQERTVELRNLKQQERESEEDWKQSPLRQARVAKILATKWSPVLDNGFFGGHPAAEFLRNAASVSNQLSLPELMTPRQVLTGNEPEDLTFEFPVSYDAITNHGFFLLLDAEMDPGSSYAADSGAQMQESTRATNGDCLLIWHTIYDPPGQHALQVQLTWTTPRGAETWCRGPAISVVTTNLCQFSLDSATYDIEFGATFHARLPETNGLYTIECVSTNGEHLKTLTGSTTNGEFKTIWNLVDDNGHRLKGETFNSIVHITLPDSGRSQTMRGP